MCSVCVRTYDVVTLVEVHKIFHKRRQYENSYFEMRRCRWPGTHGRRVPEGAVSARRRRTRERSAGLRPKVFRFSTRTPLSHFPGLTESALRIGQFIYPPEDHKSGQRTFGPI